MEEAGLPTPEPDIYFVSRIHEQVLEIGRIFHSGGMSSKEAGEELMRLINSNSKNLTGLAEGESIYTKHPSGDYFDADGNKISPEELEDDERTYNAGEYNRYARHTGRSNAFVKGFGPNRRAKEMFDKYAPVTTRRRRS